MSVLTQHFHSQALEKLGKKTNVADSVTRWRAEPLLTLAQRTATSLRSLLELEPSSFALLDASLESSLTARRFFSENRVL